ncbi:SDR family NAD(P)-dependent oxidoreductase [Motilibacter aurantiacus]|uniref:SDR family NAD(P)-dependent oxidoreductase n=1 Tax=Motilibacter aurantiacus TaxID=2714955 RepID=UPI002F2B339D
MGTRRNPLAVTLPPRRPLRAAGGQGDRSDPGDPGRRPSVVVVVGASSGIGRATALALAGRGDTVVLSARGRDGLERVAAECAGLPGRTLVLPADARSAEDMRRLAESAVASLGRIDGWVQSAGVIAYGRVEDVPSEVFRAVLETNVLGVVHAAQAALPVMRAQRSGVLVVLGSLLDKATAPLMGSYVSSKWAVRGLTRVLRQETRDAPGVSVCSVAPAGVDTPIYRSAGTYAGRLGSPPPPADAPETVAAAVLACLDRPRRQVVVGPASRLVQAGFVVLPPVYDALVGPLLRVLGLAPGRVGPTTGNVLSPDGAAGPGRT